MKNIIISPYSRKLRNDNNNAKNYPYWEELVLELKKLNFFVIQIGIIGEDFIKGVDEFQFNKSLEEIEELLKNSELFISVDNFLPHLAHSVGVNGVVIFSRSDPYIYGYKENANILKDRKYLREDQFGMWEHCEYIEDSFVSPSVIVSFIRSIQ